MPKLLQFVLPGMLLLTSCKKEEEDIPSRAALITRTSWKLSAWTSVPAYPINFSSGTVYYDDILKYYSEVNAICSGLHEFSFKKGEKDNNFQLGTFYHREGKCSSSTAGQEGRWFMHDSNDGIFLYLQSAADPSVYLDIFKVEEISYDRLAVSYKVQIIGASTVYVFTQTFKPADDN